MSTVFTGNNVHVYFTGNVDNIYPTAPYTEITNISQFPVFSTSSNVNKIETFDESYSAIILGSMSIASIDIGVYYNSKNTTHSTLDDYYESSQELQLKISYVDSEKTESYVILNGQIVKYINNGSQEEAQTRSYTFETTQLISQGQVISEPLNRGDFGVGSDGIVYSQNTQTNGNGFFHLDKNANDNPLGVDLIGTQFINKEKYTHFLSTVAGVNPQLRVRGNGGDLIKVYTEYEKPTPHEIDAPTRDDLTNSIVNLKTHVSDNYYNKTQSDSTKNELNTNISNLKLYSDTQFSTKIELATEISTLTDFVALKYYNKVESDITKNELLTSISDLKLYSDTQFSTKIELATEISTLTDFVALKYYNKVESDITKAELNTNISNLKLYSDGVFATKLELSQATIEINDNREYVAANYYNKTQIDTTLKTKVDVNKLTGIAGDSRNLICDLGVIGKVLTVSFDDLIVQTESNVQYRTGIVLNKTIDLTIVGAGGMYGTANPVNGWLAVYAIYNPTDGSTSLLGLLHTNVAPNLFPNELPAGYTASALIMDWRVLTSKFTVGNWRGRTIQFPPQSVYTGTTEITSREIPLHSVSSFNSILVCVEGTCTVAGTTGAWFSLSPYSNPDFFVRGHNGSTIVIESFEITPDRRRISLGLYIYMTSQPAGTASNALSVMGYTI
ncbi:tail fiber protein [Yersinia rohdei]|uniref:Tail fiber protein n=1 Tax=Yersinia rohdei TaxID=29485 RepID=A0A0U1HUP4_YERRO|nr:hypothetical protein [Yersinia rohdei]CQI92570.1 tail fiber protein [Yersinia rohdei]